MQRFVSDRCSYFSPCIYFKQLLDTYNATPIDEISTKGAKTQMHSTRTFKQNEKAAQES